MDCLEFRRLLGSDPHALGREARAHLESCAFCADAHARAQAFEAQLADVLRVPVPAGLADRILLAELTGERSRRRVLRGALGWSALAAAACLALAIGAAYRPASPPPLSALVADHVTGPHERDALRRERPLPDSMVRRAFAARGIDLDHVPAGVSYVNECIVGDYRTVHMVMPQDGEPISVVYVARHREPERDFAGDGLRGREVPIANGTLFLLARDDRRFGALEQAWRGALAAPPRLAAAFGPAGAPRR